MSDKKQKKDSLKAQLERLGYGRDAKGQWVKDGADREDSRERVRREVRRQMKREKLRRAETRAPETSSRHPAGPSRSPVLYRRDLPRQQAARPQPVRPRGATVDLEKSLEGVSVTETTAGNALLLRIPADEVKEVDPVSARFCEHLSKLNSALCKQVESTCNPADISPEDIIFMDVESTGLGNSPLFLIGVMVWAGDSFEVQQYFARNYAEEAAVVSMFLDACRERKLLVTFNGKSFDFPYIRTRAAATGLPFNIDSYHMDMLHVCRRIWKTRLPDCKLQTLETFICNRTRYDDIPGAEIPDAYHEFVRTSDGWRMLKVLKHNVLDLITMADLMTRFPAKD